MRTTSVALGDYFERFIKAKIAQGVITMPARSYAPGCGCSKRTRAARSTCKNAVAEGFDSGIAEGFDPERHLQHLKARRADD